MVGESLRIRVWKGSLFGLWRINSFYCFSSSIPYVDFMWQYHL